MQGFTVFFKAWVCISGSAVGTSWGMGSNPDITLFRGSQYRVVCPGMIENGGKCCESGIRG